MSLERYTSQALSRWMEGAGPESDIALSSRLRLARNVAGIPFSHVMSDEQAARVLQKAKQAAEELNRFGFLGKVEFFPLAEVPPLDRQVLVEKHLISPQQAQDVRYKGLILSQDESVSIMVNEEDHFRIQCLFAGLQLEEAWKLASRVDDALEQVVPFAFSEQHGYLTACPTNVGTGIRASVMMHLPALVLTKQAGRVFHTATQLGLAVRGLYGEGTEAIGNIFQVSNQITLGRTEEETVAHLKAVSLQIIEQERTAREVLQSESQGQLEDRVWRAYGILSNARVLTSEEAMGLLSEVRLGVDLGMIKTVTNRTMNEFLVLTRPHFLQKSAGRDLSPRERDLRRASLIRERLNPVAGGFASAES